MMGTKSQTALATTLAALAMFGCDARPTQNVAVETSATEGRVSVRRIECVQDSLAYGGVRGIYIITDNKTGKEFIGISGIGISEIGSHSSGKTLHQDER